MYSGRCEISGFDVSIITDLEWPNLYLLQLGIISYMQIGIRLETLEQIKFGRSSGQNYQCFDFVNINSGRAKQNRWSGITKNSNILNETTESIIIEYVYCYRDDNPIGRIGTELLSKANIPLLKYLMASK